MKRLYFIGMSVVCLSLSGCFLWTSRNDGEIMKQKVQQFEDRMDQLDAENKEKRQQMADMIDDLRGKLESLEASLGKATKVLARNSADFGVDMEAVRGEMRNSKGAQAELNHQLSQMKTQIEETRQQVKQFALAAGLDMPIDETKVSRDPKIHFKMIKSAFAERRYGEVRSSGKVFLSRHPKSSLCDDVQRYIAKSYLEQKRWAKALGALRQLSEKYPKSQYKAEVLYEMARSFYYLGDCTDAGILIEAVITRHKNSPFVQKANLLKNKIANTQSRCTS